MSIRFSKIPENKIFKNEFINRMQAAIFFRKIALYKYGRMCYNRKAVRNMLKWLSR